MTRPVPDRPDSFHLRVPRNAPFRHLLPHAHLSLPSIPFLSAARLRQPWPSPPLPRSCAAASVLVSTGEAPKSSAALRIQALASYPQIPCRTSRFRLSPPASRGRIGPGAAHPHPMRLSTTSSRKKSHGSGGLVLERSKPAALVLACWGPIRRPKRLVLRLGRIEGPPQNF
nr:uncharacterized protein LOC127308457 isoform X1 [Lolium perenne]